MEKQSLSLNKVNCSHENIDFLTKKAMIVELELKYPKKI